MKKIKMAEVIFLLLGLICVIYGMMIFRLHTGAMTYILWFGLGVIFALCAVVMHLELWSMLPGAVRAGFGIIFIILIFSFNIIEGFIVSGCTAKGESDLDYIIVLGAQVTERGPSRVLKYRLDKAYDYLTENENTKCIVSGGKGANEPYAEAVGMKKYLLEKGIPEERIIVEDKSLTTLENMIYSKELIEKEASVGIVTNNFHVFRGVRLAKHVGIKNVCGIAAKSHPMYLPNNMFREYFGVLKDIGRII